MQNKFQLAFDLFGSIYDLVSIILTTIFLYISMKEFFNKNYDRSVAAILLGFFFLLDRVY